MDEATAPSLKDAVLVLLTQDTGILAIAEKGVTVCTKLEQVESVAVDRSITDVVVALDSPGREIAQQVIDLMTSYPEATIRVAVTPGGVSRLPANIAERLVISGLEMFGDGLAVLPLDREPGPDGQLLREWTRVVLNKRTTYAYGVGLEDEADSLRQLIESVDAALSEKEQLELEAERLRKKIRTLENALRASERRYRALANSKLGRLTLKIWKRRKSR